MAQTPGGTYYAASSELVSSWPATSLDLANQLESRFAAKAATSQLKVVQVVSASYATQVVSTSGAYADTGLTASITPTSASNSILVMVNQNGVYKNTNNTGVKIRLVRGSTEIALLSEDAAITGNTNANNIGTVSIQYSDSPATTSSTTYKTQFLSVTGQANAVVQYQGGRSTIVLMEIAP